MSEVAYLVSKPNGGRSSALHLPKARSRVRRQARARAEQARVKVRGVGEYGAWRPIPAALDRWEEVVAGVDVGNVVLLDLHQRPYTVKTRVIDVEPPVNQTVGNSRVDAIHTFYFRTWRGWSGGICARRYVAGTTTWTQHCPWPDPDEGSNAEDFFSTPDTMDELMDRAVVLAREGRRWDDTGGQEGLPIGRLIVAQRQWTPESDWYYYGGELHTHIHAEGRPTRFGQPRASCP